MEKLRKREEKLKIGHALLAPSSAERWMTCIGSVAMEANSPEITTIYSDEGTAAHALASMCLKTGNDPVAFHGRVLTVVDGVYAPTNERPALYVNEREFIVDDDMVESVRAYIDKVREYGAGDDSGANF